MNQPPPNPNSLHIPIITTPNPLLNLLFPSLRPKQINIPHRTSLHKIRTPITRNPIQRTLLHQFNPTKPNQLDIPQHPHIKPTKIAPHINNRSSTTRSKVKTLLDRQFLSSISLRMIPLPRSRLTQQPRSKTSLSRRFKNTRTIPPTNIRAQTNRNPLIKQRPDRTNTRSQRRVRRRTMGDLCFARADQSPLIWR